MPRHPVVISLCLDCENYSKCDYVNDLIHSANFLESCLRKNKSFKNVSISIDCKERVSRQKHSI